MTTRLRSLASFATLALFAVAAMGTGKPKGGSSSSGGGAPGNATGDDKSPIAQAPAALGAGAADQEIVQRLTKKLTTAVGCPALTSVHRIWCAVDGFAAGTRAPLPQGAMVGLTVGLSEDFPAEQSLQRNVELSALGAKSSSAGPFAWITSIKPKTPGESQSVGAGVASAAAFFKQGSPEIRLDASLFGYVEGLPSAAKYPLQQAPSGWRIAGPATTELRKVGDVWVAIEVPPARPLRGIYVSILSPKYGKAP